MCSEPVSTAASATRLSAESCGGGCRQASSGGARAGEADAPARPRGVVWCDADGEVLLHPDEAVVTAIRTIFDRFAEMGSARRVWLWLRGRGLKLPLQMHAHADIRWVDASYHAVHQATSTGRPMRPTSSA